MEFLELGGWKSGAEFLFSSGDMCTLGACIADGCVCEHACEASFSHPPHNRVAASSSSLLT